MFKKPILNFEIPERKILLRVFDILFVFLFFKFSNIFFDFNYFRFNNFSSIIVLSIYIQFFGSVFELYDLKVSSNQYLVVRSLILTSFFTHIFFLFTPYFTPSLPNNRLEIIYFLLLIFSALFTWRFIYLKIFASTKFNKNVLMIANAENYNELIKDLNEADPHYKIIAFYNNKKSSKTNQNLISSIELNDLKNVVFQNKIKEIIIDTQHKNNFNIELYDILLYFVENGIDVKKYSQVYEELTYRIPIQHLSKDYYNFFPFSRNNHNKLYKIYTRIFDIVFSFLFLMILIAILPVVVFLNVFMNKGNLFYTQERVGKNGKSFKIYKLRTMIKDAEANGAVFATVNDSRITKFGKILRKSRIDEIPQVFNILKGDMSVIGPRPERPIFVNQISKNIPFYNSRHFVKPGLTGWAQVNHSYTDNIDDALYKLQLDLYYVKKRDFFLDIDILIKTLSTVVYFKGQ
jgi:exopolysaccharide biosynthesis polyprenyl glycosylphosphotransferase